jgi:6-phosphogluconolactonase
MTINKFDSVDEVLEALADYFVDIVRQSIADHGQFSVALSGGSSPKKLYDLLASPAYNDKVEWKKVHFFFGDERDVPQDHKDSNYLMAKKALFEPLELSATQVFPVDTSLNPKEAAEKYTTDIEHYFAGEDIRFDLVLLGLGDNSHTASLFPHTPVLHDKSISAKEVYLEDQKIYRITMTYGMINQARNIAFLVYGAGKAEAVHHVIEDEKNIDEYPAQLIVAEDGHLQWFLDKAAASQLS